MTLKDARQLRDYIHSKDSINCTVPLGHGPCGYFPQSILSTGPRDWTSRQDFRDWLATRIRERRVIQRQYDAVMRRPQRARSPIEMMIDKACGFN